MKRSFLTFALLITLLVMIFSNLQTSEAQTVENEVSLSSSSKKYYGVFVAGPGKGWRKSMQEVVYGNSKNYWIDALLDYGQGWSPSRITQLESPTGEQVKAAIDYWKDKVEPGDEFHFYFAGHGDKGGNFYLADGPCWGAKLGEWLSGFKKGVTISVVFDSCYSHKTIEGLRSFIKDDSGSKIEKRYFAAAASTHWFFPWSFGMWPSGNFFTNGLIYRFKLSRSLGKDPVKAMPLFSWALATVHNATYGDQDGDGYIDEDGGLMSDYYEEVPNSLLGEDDDGDGLIDEDPPTQMGSQSGVGGCWKFEEGSGIIAFDSFGNDNNGTINGDPVWVDGISGLALHFDGVDDNVMIPDSDSLHITDPLIIDFWFKPDVEIYPGFEEAYLLVGKWHGIGDQARTGFLVNLNVNTHPGDGKMRFWLGFGNWEMEILESTRNVWHAGEWYHITATYDRSLPSGNAKLYINGTLDSQKHAHKAIAANTLPLYINLDPYELWHPYNTYFPGIIDEVIVYGMSAYILTISSSSGGTTSPSPGKYTYEARTETVVSVAAIPDTNYFFDHWELDGAFYGTSNPTTVTMNANHHLHAVFTYTPPPPQPPPPGVGGYVIPVDKIGLLAPYIGLASTTIIAITATIVYVKRFKHKKQKQ